MPDREVHITGSKSWRSELWSNMATVHTLGFSGFDKSATVQSIYRSSLSPPVTLFMLITWTHNPNGPLLASIGRYVKSWHFDPMKILVSNLAGQMNRSSWTSQDIKVYVCKHKCSFPPGSDLFLMLDVVKSWIELDESRLAVFVKANSANELHSM